MRKTRTPMSWYELLDRMSFLLCDEEDAKEWLRQALDAKWGVISPADLSKQRRAVAFQKCAGALLAMEDFDGDLAFFVEQRVEVRGAFARYLDGLVLEGPPWRVGPNEMDRPTRANWEAETGF